MKKGNAWKWRKYPNIPLWRGTCGCEWIAYIQRHDNGVFEWWMNPDAWTPDIAVYEGKADDLKAAKARLEEV